MMISLAHKLNSVTIPLLHYIKAQVSEGIVLFSPLASDLIERSIKDLSLAVQGCPSDLTKHHRLDFVLFDEQDLEDTDMLQPWAKQAPLDWYVLRLKNVPAGLYLVMAITRHKMVSCEKTVIELYDLSLLRAEDSYTAPLENQEISKSDWMLTIAACDHLEDDTVIFPLGLIYLYEFQPESMMMLVSISDHAHIIDVTLVSVK